MTKACQSNSVVELLKILMSGVEISGAKSFSSHTGRGEHDWDKNGTQKAFTNSRANQQRSRQAAVYSFASKCFQNITGLSC